MFRKSYIGKFIIAESFSLVGSAMIPVVLSFSVYALGGREETVGKLLAVQTIPFVFLLPFSGAIIARYTALRVLIFSEIICLLSEISISVYFSETTLHVTPIFILCAVLGAGASFVIPSGETLVPELVETRHLQKVNSAIGIIAAFGAMVGPTLGGLVISNLGTRWAILADAMTYAVSVFFLLGIPQYNCQSTNTDPFFTLVTEGWREFRRQPWLTIMVGVYAGFHLLVLGPAYVIASSALTQVEYGAERWGLLLGIMAAGHIGGGIVSMNLNCRRPLVLALVSFSTFFLAPASIAVTPALLVQVPAFFVAGGGLAIFSVVWETTKQKIISPHMLSRVSAIATLGSASLLPVGYLMGAPLTNWLGEQKALYFTSICCLFLAILGLTFPSVRNLYFTDMTTLHATKDD
ncbi:MFS transporter [Komagataeibacter nataicola]|nr:MFS transporter [Komagataeibacter nataicola]